MSENNQKERFLKIYANLPIKVREEIIAILPDIGTITWNVAYLEVSNNTELSKQILKQLNEMEII